MTEPLRLSRLRAAAAAAALAWIGLVASIAAIAGAELGIATGMREIALGGMAVMAIGSIAAVIAAMGVHCPKCGARLMVENLGPKHRSADRVSGLTHWATVVIRVLQLRRITCMYCGAQYPTRM